MNLIKRSFAMNDLIDVELITVVSLKPEDFMCSNGFCFNIVCTNTYCDNSTCFNTVCTNNSCA